MMWSGEFLFSFCFGQFNIPLGNWRWAGLARRYGNALVFFA